MGLGEVQRLLLDVGASRRNGQYIEAALDGTGVSVTDLLAAELVREEGELYTLAFPLLTTENQRVLLEISERYARGLADAYLRQRGEFDELLSRYPVAGIAKTSLAYLLVGCFSLDWDGIQLTQELGYRTPFGTQGVPTVYWAIETENREVAYPKAVYWGSHNEYLDNGIAFTSFGDFASIPRHGLPDLAWYMARSLRSVDVPHELAPIVERVGWGALQGALEQAGAIMMALRSGEKSADEISDATGINSGDTRQLLTLLEALGYVRRVTDDYAIAIPVFAEEDRSMVLDLIDLSREIMTSWLAENYDPCKAELARTTPLGNVLPFENTFWNVWHYLFGAANRILVEQGMFADPYGVDRRYKGFIPAVWHRSVNRRG
ncbi:MAG: helix-turn-helix transcriptional regulator [Gemmatimonadota bacterium]|nr:MAG: helix-turn-helix transcriptional regulator [Gemmatimonadota bacterium]